MSKKELNFEKNYNHLEVEKRIVNNWEDNKIYVHFYKQKKMTSLISMLFQRAHRVIDDII